MSTPEGIRPELAGIVTARYGTSGLETARFITPTDKQVEDYERHHGLLTLWVRFDHDPSLVIIDTGRLLLVRHFSIGRQRVDGLGVVIRSGNHPVSEEILRNGTVTDRRVEALELSIHYTPNLAQIPYRAQLRPLT